MDKLVIYGKEKNISEFKIQLSAGSLFSILFVLCLVGVIELRAIVFFLIPMFLFYGYVFSMLSLKEERLCIDSGYISYFRGNTRKLNIPLKEIKSVDILTHQKPEGFSLQESLFIIYLNDGNDISAPYKLLDSQQIDEFFKSVLSNYLYT